MASPKTAASSTMCSLRWTTLGTIGAGRAAHSLTDCSLTEWMLERTVQPEAAPCHRASAPALEVSNEARSDGSACHLCGLHDESSPKQDACAGERLGWL